ncbi:T9SS type A sorting domain-containing protein [Chryseobacterium sp. c4a]|uniref:T9SS type A sorting domain-containing protein n=1 Tax=Chryseobacterium sp. c4a TaxID=1573582 RepID=UPI0013572DE0|nr:T9SS type A sorting domain-containing protein [Chryseobacterium sp. c4a]
MKKIYSIACSLLALLSFAQQTVSFEDNEGFAPGNIHGQGAWISTPTGGTPENVIHQTISTDAATDGNSALKIVKESIYGVQSEPIIGGFYNLTTPLISTLFSVSFDINMSQIDGSVFGFQGFNNSNEQTVVRVDFDKTGIIKVLNKNLNVQNMVSTAGVWSPNTWYRLKVVGTAANTQYYLNDILFYTETTAIPLTMDQLRFVHNNDLGIAYIDNIKINEELILSAKEAKTDSKIVTVYPNPVTDYVHLRLQFPMSKAEVYTAEGRAVNVIFKNNVADVRDLAPGVYLIKIIYDDEMYYLKFIKK